MAERVWTKEQSDAIYSRGGTLLLSAAAGSGKTAVLVERITKLMTEGNEPVSPENLLVVTFTNAAAAEMRARINDSIDALTRKDPANSFYRSIKMKLPEAKITTMDSFCIGLVRENFHLADTEPDFAILDSSEAQLLISEALNMTLEKMCTEAPEIYNILNTVTSYNRDDEALTGKIQHLYNYSLSHPFPDKWLDTVTDMYSPTDNVKDTLWGKIIIDEIKQNTEYCCTLLASAISAMRCDEVIDGLYSAEFTIMHSRLTDAITVIEQKDWDSVFRCFEELRFGSLPKVPRGYGKNPVKMHAEGQYKLAAKLIDECRSSICTDTLGHNEDMAVLQPVITGLIDAVRDFRRNYDELKKQRNSYTFTDIMHKALSLLITEENGEIKKSALAYDLQQSFREILIDEYQDTNEAQDMLFSTLSKNNTNMFMVGDVKQSIYRFRLAMPEIFVRKSREYADFDNETYPAKIILGRNFRSRKGVLDNINFLFKNIMSDYVGEMEYTDKEALYFGGGYDEDKEPAVELRLLRTKSRDEEAAYIAATIKKIVSDGVTVQDKTGERKAGYGDFCILLRSTSGKADIYEAALKEQGIPVSCEKKSGLFSCHETGIFTSLLKVISNPTDDVAMLTVMFSPLYGFSADEAAEIKLYGKKSNLYTCLKASAADIKKSQLLIDDLQTYRRMAAVMPVDAFIRTLLDTTGYLSTVSACENGEGKRLNLLMLCSVAADYASKGSTGLGGFIRYISRITAGGNDISAASDASADSQAVKILSIHKSKGLEFPFVILADCAKTFNKSDMMAEMIISPAAGIGMKISNSKRLQQYSTLSHSAARLAIKRATASEEMRILYVAMTRARERFIAVCSTAKPEEKLVSAANSYQGNVAAPCAVLHADSYMQWMLMGYIRHPDMRRINDYTGGYGDSDFLNADSRMKFTIEEPCDIQENEITEEAEAALSDDALISIIRERAGYTYPFVLPENARPKKAASDFEEKHFNAEYFAKAKPSFEYSDKLTSAEAGTANHLFLQNLDFSAASVEAELERMQGCGILNKKQAAVINTEKVRAFITSELFSRIKNASEIYREKEFTVPVELCEIYPSLPDNVQHEKIIVQGIADLVFVENGEAVIVDYKTDKRKTPEDFRKTYSGQLYMYRRAMEQILEIPVKETLIYSIDSECTIDI